MTDVVEYTGQEEFKMSNKEAIKTGFDKANEIGRTGDYWITWQTEDEYRRIQEVLTVALKTEMCNMLQTRYNNILYEMKKAMGLTEAHIPGLDAQCTYAMDFWRTTY